jgi:hypothetical protein
MSLCRTLEGGAQEMCEGRYTRAKLEVPSADIGQQDALAGRPHGGLRRAGGYGAASAAYAISDSLAFAPGRGTPNRLGLRPLRRYCDAATRLPLLAFLRADRVVER